MESEAIHARLTRPLLAVRVNPVGALGTVMGVISEEGAEAALKPTAFRAVTVKIYVAPLTSPVTVQVNAPVVEQRREVSCAETAV